jgi:hypothetical protein
VANPIIQEATSATTGLTYIALYTLTDASVVDKCEILVKQSKDEIVICSARTPDEQITSFKPIEITNSATAKPIRLSNFLKADKAGKEDRLVKNLLVTTKSSLEKVKGNDLIYDVVTVENVSGTYQLQVSQSTVTDDQKDSLGFKLLQSGEPGPGESTEETAAVNSLDDEGDAPAAVNSLDDEGDAPAAVNSLDDEGDAPATAGGTERRTDDVGGDTSGGGAATQKKKEKEAASGKSGSPPAKTAPKKEPSVSGMRKAINISDFLRRKEYEAAGIPLKRAGEEGKEPEGFTMVQTIPDPMGDRTGSEYNDPRYVFKSDVKPDDSGDYVGDSYKYNVWIDPNKIKTKADLADDNNMQYVYFEIAEDNFDERPYGVDKDRDFTGLKIYHDGSITGNKAGLGNASFFNILYTYLELWNSYKKISTLPPAPEAPAPAPTPAAPGPTPDAPPASADPGPDVNITVTPPAPGGGERKTGPCCHTGVKLALACYKNTWTEYPNGVTPKDCDSIYREKAGNVPNFLRGIEKDGDEWLHYIKDKQTGNFVAVTTTGNTLLNYAQSASIKKIKIFKGGLGGFRDSAKTNDPEFNNVFRTLRTTIKDVRVFLPYDPSRGPDSCGLTDDEVFARTDWTIQLREDKQMRIIRRQIRNLLLSQRS